MDKNQKLEELLKIANDGVSREELLLMFEKISTHILKVEAKIIERVEKKTIDAQEKLEELTNELKEIIVEARKESDSTFGGIKRRMMEVINSRFVKSSVNNKLQSKLDEATATIAAVNAKLASIRDGIDGQDGVSIPGEPGKPGKDGKDADPIDEEALFERLRKHIPRGGGTSAMGVAQAFKNILHTEEPVGDIDGVNTTYTVSHTIFAVLAFSLSGEVIPQIPNYTIAGKTITFSPALPAAYAGRDFEIKYI